MLTETTSSFTPALKFSWCISYEIIQITFRMLSILLKTLFSYLKLFPLFSNLLKGSFLHLFKVVPVSPSRSSGIWVRACFHKQSYNGTQPSPFFHPSCMAALTPWWQSWVTETTWPIESKIFNPLQKSLMAPILEDLSLSTLWSFLLTNLLLSVTFNFSIAMVSFPSTCNMSTFNHSSTNFNWTSTKCQVWRIWLLIKHNPCLQ